MAYRLAGAYVGNCTCKEICPCAVDGPPTGPDGKCHGTLVFGVREGNLDGQDLSGVNFALYYFVPKTFSAGDWRQGVIVDESASDEQVQALERILTGKEGGPFEDFAALVGEWLGAERGRVSFSDGEAPSAKLGDTEIDFEPYRGTDGNPTVTRNALFGLAPEFMPGKSSARVEMFGDSWQGVYGEAATAFEFAT